MKIITFIFFLSAFCFSQSIQDSTKVWNITWDTNPLPDTLQDTTAFYRVYQIQVSDSTLPDSLLEYSAIAEVPHINGSDSTTHEIHFMTNTKVFVAWTVRAVSDAGRESENATNINGKLDRTRFFAALPPSKVGNIDLQTTENGYQISWPGNPENDIHFYNIWQITGNDSACVIFTRIDRILHEVETAKYTYDIAFTNRDKKFIAWAVSAVDHQANQGIYAQTSLIEIVRIKSVKNMRMRVMKIPPETEIIIEIER